MDACAKVSAFLLNACGCRNLASVFRKDRPMDVCLGFPTCLRFFVVVLQSVCLSASTLSLTTSTSCLYFFSSHTPATGLHHPKDSWHQDILAPLQKPRLLQFAWNEIRLFYWIEMERRHKGQTWRLRSDSWRLEPGWLLDTWFQLQSQQQTRREGNLPKVFNITCRGHPFPAWIAGRLRSEMSFCTVGSEYFLSPLKSLSERNISCLYVWNFSLKMNEMKRSVKKVGPLEPEGCWEWDRCFFQ